MEPEGTREGKSSGKSNQAPPEVFKPPAPRTESLEASLNALNSLDPKAFSSVGELTSYILDLMPGSHVCGSKNGTKTAPWYMEPKTKTCATPVV